MTARVLVVDDILANVKLLEARLAAEYFDVLTACSAQEALDICDRERVDVVLLDVMMPGMDGFEACRRLKSNPKTHHIPVVLVTALDQVSDKLRGLDGGADDFLTKPVDEIALVTRVKNLARLKMLTDEMLMRALTGRQTGISEDVALMKALSEERARILVVDDDAGSARRLSEWLSTVHEPVVTRGPQTALALLAEREFDLLIVSLRLSEADGLRLCSQTRSLDRTRHLPIIVLVEPGDEPRLLRALDMGVNDYIMRPIDRNELMARVRTQVKRKRYSDHLRNRLEESIEAAMIDPLTGLHNRRYMESHLRTLVADAIHIGPLALGADGRHRSLQERERHLRPRRRRLCAQGVLDPLPPQHARHRSRLPLRRRGVPRDHAGHQHAAGLSGGRETARGHRVRSLPGAPGCRNSPDRKRWYCNTGECTGHAGVCFSPRR